MFGYTEIPETWGNKTLDGISEEKFHSTQWDRNLQAALGWAQKQGTLTPDQKREMVREYWQSPRDKSAKHRLAEKYGVAVVHIDNTAHECKYLTKRELDTLKQEWYEQYGLQIEVISPGCDQLAEYDRLNQYRSDQMRLRVPPSVIWNIRFGHSEYLSTRDIYEIARPYYDNRPTTDSDWSYYKMLRRNRLNWLVDTPSRRVTVSSLEDAEQFYTEVTGLKATSGVRRLWWEGKMGWQGKIGGWQFKDPRN